MLTFNDHNKFTWANFKQALLAILLIICFAFGVLFISGKTLIANSDALNQHVQVFAKFHEYLITFLQHPKQFGTWDWTLSNGTDWYSAFSYYILGDPLGYLMIFFDQQHTILGYQLIVLLRYGLAGLAVAYLGIKFGVTNRWLPVLIVTYLGSLFGVYGVINQSLFLNAMIGLPLLIVGIEKYFSAGHFKLLIISVALTVASNFYWGIILAEIVLAYAVVTYLVNYRQKDWLKTWRWLIIYVLIGIMIASLVLLPMIMYLLSSPRNGSGLQEILSLYPLEYYLKLLTLPFGIFGIAQPSSFWLQGTASAVNTFGFIWILINRRKNKVALTLLIIIIWLLILPASAVLLTVGNVPTNRWMFSYYLLTAVLGVNLLSQRGSISQYQQTSIKWMLLIGVSGYLFLSYINEIPLAQEIGYLVTLAIMTYYLLNNTHRWARPRVEWIIFFGVVVTMMMQLYLPSNRQEVLAMLSPDRIKEIVIAPTGLENKFSPQTSARTEFANGTRTEHNELFINTFLTNAHATGLYLSTANPAMIDFSNQLAIISGRTVNPLRNLDNRFFLTNYFGVNQIVSSPGNKAAFYPGLEKIAQGKTLNLYHNKYAFPIVWQTKTSYAEKVYQKSNPIIKQNLLGMGNLATKHADSKMQPPIIGLEQLLPTATLQQVTKSQHVKKQPDKIIATQTLAMGRLNHTVTVKITNTNSTVNLQLPQYALQGELLVYLAKMKFKPLTLKEINQYQPKANWKQKYLYRNDGYTITLDTGQRVVDFEQASTSAGAFYQLRKDGVLNFGVPNKSPQRIIMHFNKPGTYRFNIKVYNQQLNVRSLQKITQIHQQQLQNVKLNYAGVTGQVTSNATRWLGSNIPYSKGWTATVAGNKVPVEKVNGAFLGIKVSHAKGATVNLKYETPGLKLGVVITIIGWIMFGGLIMLRKRQISVAK